MMVAEALILLMLVAQPSGEEDTEERKAEAGQHLERGNAAMKEGDPRAALEAYRAAYDAYPSPKIFFNMAEAHREMGDLVEAAQLYQRVVEELSPDTPLVATAQERLAAVEEKLGRVSVTTEPSGAKIEIEGRDVGTSPVTDVLVQAGSVSIRATLDERSETKTVEVDAGGTRAVEFDLVDVAAPPPPPPPFAEEGEGPVDTDDDSIVGKWWFWTLIGVGVVAAGTTAAVLATSGGDFRPEGELGTYSLTDWSRL